MRNLNSPLRTFKRIRLVVGQLGGFSLTLRAALQLFRQEGFSGVLRGMRHATFPPPVNPSPGSGEFDRNDYTQWTLRYDTQTEETRAALRSRTSDLKVTPLISVIMPVYNPKPEWLIEAIDSVRHQIYPHWELCIADDASMDKQIRTILEQHADQDARIKLVIRKQNGHICAASNSALQLASGAWIALLDHDDILAEHALFWVAHAINQQPQARIIYSDEDKIDQAGKRSDPYFKCDWNVELFRAQNMISHLGVYHAQMVREIGGFRVGLEGSQDYDLALRCLERIAPTQVHHIPRVLYHWRVHAGSTALSGTAKPYAVLASERALNEHFDRQQIAAKAVFVGWGYRVRYALPTILPMVSLIMPTRNALPLLKPCVNSILSNTSYPNFELLIVDNGSNDTATLQYLGSLQGEPRVRVVRDERPFNYSALNNAAVRMVQGELLALVNNDLEVTSSDWLSEMVSVALQPGVGAVGARLWYPDNTLQHGGVVLGLDGIAGHAQKRLRRGAYGYFSRACLTQDYSAVTAACLVIRKSIYEEVGGLNEIDLAVAFNDVDFCLRVREAGYRNVWTPFAEMYHLESATRGIEDTPEKQQRFSNEVQYMKQRWGEQLLNDPAYNPNLTLVGTDFSLAWPPRVC